MNKQIISHHLLFDSVFRHFSLQCYHHFVSYVAQLRNKRVGLHAWMYSTHRPSFGLSWPFSHFVVSVIWYLTGYVFWYLLIFALRRSIKGTRRSIQPFVNLVPLQSFISRTLLYMDEGFIELPRSGADAIRSMTSDDGNLDRSVIMTVEVGDEHAPICVRSCMFVAGDFIYCG
jgi:hypothetical protein